MAILTKKVRTGVRLAACPCETPKSQPDGAFDGNRCGIVLPAQAGVVRVVMSARFYVLGTKQSGQEPCHAIRYGRFCTSAHHAVKRTSISQRRPLNLIQVVDAPGPIDRSGLFRPRASAGV